MKKKAAVLLTVCILLFFGTAEVVSAAEAGNTEEKASVDIAEMLGEAGDKLKAALSEIDSETAMEMFDFVGEKLADGSLKTKEGLSDALEEGKEKFGITVDEEDAKKVVETMKKLEDMGFSGEYAVERTKELYEEYGADFVDHANEVMKGAVEQAVTDAVTAFFQNLWEAVKKFFINLFSKI